MTPKEKAKELIEKFKRYSWISCFEGGEELSNIESAKYCALIAVDEIIYEHNLHLTKFGHECILFWKEVKQELEKL